MNMLINSLQTQVANALEIELDNSGSSPIFFNFMNNMIIKYRNSPHIDFLNRIQHYQRNINMTFQMSGISVGNVNDVDLLNDFMNYFYPQDMRQENAELRRTQN